MTNNQLAEKSVIQLLNSVKLACDNAERADNRVDHSFYYALTIALEELQERRKAERDSEPVILYRQVNPANGMKTYWAELDQEEFRHLKKYTDENAEFMTLYRHAQPAPVVPEEKPIPNTLSMYAVDAVAAIAEVKGWNACRAAMLQAEPVTTANKLGNPPVIPDGYVMVPIEPTMSQELAGYKTLNDTGRMSRLMKTRLSNIYRAMLASCDDDDDEDDD